MVYDVASQSYVLGTTSYPRQSAVYFRARLAVPGRPFAISNVVGPFDLSSNLQHLGTSALYVTHNGPVANIRFGVTESVAQPGLAVAIQATKTPTSENSWTNISGGALTQDSNASTEFYLGLDDYPAGEGVYFRAVATLSGYVMSVSGASGPYTFINDPAATVSITLGNGQTGGEDFDFPIQVNPGSFNVTANAQSGRFLQRVDLVYDGDILEDFDKGAAGGTTLYSTNVFGDHLIEASATDDLAVTGYARPAHVRVAPPAPGRLLFLTTSGSWSNENIWVDGQGNHAVPGPDDFAVVGSVDVTVSSDVTVGALSLNDGTISGSSKLTVSHFCTLGAGRIKSDMEIALGATCLMINDTDVGLGGRVTIAGRLKIHGKAGVTGIPAAPKTVFNGVALDSASIDGLFDGIVAFFKNVGQVIFHPAAGGRKGSVKASPPPPAVTAPEVRTILLSTLQNSGKIVAQGGGNIVAQGGGNIISTNGGGIVAQGGGNLVNNTARGLVDANGNPIVAQGGGNIVAQGAGNIVAQGGGNLIPPVSGIVAQGGGNIVAQGGGNLVPTGGPNIVAQGGGNIVAQGGGNIAARAGSQAVASTAGFSQTAGETDLNQITIIGSVALSGGVMTGSGVVVGDVTNSSGFIAPGHSPGTLAITGSFTQGSSGTLIIEASGGEAGQFDEIQVGGGVSLAGRLDLKAIDGYVPLAGDAFNPVGYGSVTGSFSSVSGNGSLTINSTGALVLLDPGQPNPPYGQPTNISTRMKVLTNDNILIGGFIVNGPSGSTKKVLIHGLGPSLSSAHLTGLLSDPLLEFHYPDGTVVTNDNWS
ncbi:MAG: hypothetical protein M3128_07760, partial [Verrucomicrobiota bacterium]|nr:hypothetical protein [Verrucomicrobiota bacterium]